MGLEQFIRALETCQDEDLNKELGVDDNWVIYLNGDRETVVRDLLQSGRYYREGVEFLFNEQRGVAIRVLDRTFKPIGVKVDEQRLKDYNTTLMILADLDNRSVFGGKNMLKIIAQVISDVGRYLLEQRLPYYFPMSKPPIYYPN